MSELPVDATEPAAVASEEAVKTEPVNPTAAAEIETAKVENGSSQQEVKDEKDEKKGPRVYREGKDKGVLMTSRQQEEGVNNSKYDASILPVTDDPVKIRNQVEFYFSDSNLPSDKYLWGLCDGASNLPVSIEKICSFSRMKRFKPLAAVVDALKESEFLKVTGPDGDEGVSRKLAYNPKNTAKDPALTRSIYAKGFGDEEPSTQFDVEAFFAPYGPTNAVRLRRTDDKLFKGSVFVEFADEETQQKFLALDPKPLWKGEHLLKITSKEEYVESKKLDIAEGRMEPNRSNYRNGSQRGNGRGRGRGRGGDRGGNRGGFRDRNDRDKGDRDPNDWKKRREEDRANGFKDDRKGGQRPNRGRGGRGGNRDREDRNGRLNDRNREREEKKNDVKSDSAKDEKKAREDNGENEAASKTEKSETIPTDAPAASSPTKNLKRGRETEGGAEEQPSKKVDTKSDGAVETS